MVSILVVVDQFPEVSVNLGVAYNADGFNPCCGGSVSGGRILSTIISSPSVSILVVVDQFPEASEGQCYPRSNQGFNPCCGGSVSGGFFDVRDRLRDCEFQSLLWWISFRR